MVTDNSNMSADEIDLLILYDSVMEKKWFILLVTAICSIISSVYVSLNYQGVNYQATALIQIENKSTAFGFSQLSSLAGGGTNISSELELMTSRTLIGEVVEQLGLKIEARPDFFPLIGTRAYRYFTPNYHDEFGTPLFNATQFAWGGESIDVSIFEPPNKQIGKVFKLVAGANNSFSLYNAEDHFILNGTVGHLVTIDQYKLQVDILEARAGTQFKLVSKDPLDVIKHIKSKLKIGLDEKRSSEIVSLSYIDQTPERAEQVLNKIINIFIQHNAQRNSKEVKNSLEFLQTQLPLIQKNLEKSETRYNNYQKSKRTYDINFESRSLLSTLDSLNRRLQDLQDQHLELSHKYTSAHPNIRGIEEKISSVELQITATESKLQNLPETQKELSQLTRKVEVGKETYIQLLSKTQELELEIIRAGSANNIDIIDVAQADRTPKTDRKAYIITIIATLMGFSLSVIIAIFKRALNKGIEDISQIEALGIPIYASLPFATEQKNISKKHLPPLAASHPENIAIEHFRGLRTSLHFALVDADEKIISITGSSPDIGKSFVSTNLAIVLANTNMRILLIDGDLRRGELHKSFGLNPRPGLSEALLGTLPYTDSIQHTDINGLDLISRGSMPPNPAELLMNPRFKELLQDISSSYDFILIDTPPILTVTDSAIIAKHCSATLLVTKYRETTLQEIEFTRKRFEQNGVEIKGAIFNGVIKSSRYYTSLYQ